MQAIILLLLALWVVRSIVSIVANVDAIANSCDIDDYSTESDRWLWFDDDDDDDSGGSYYGDICDGTFENSYWD